MTETFESMLAEGYKTWRNNMVLAVPAVANAIAVVLVAMASVAVFILALLLLLRPAGLLNTAVVLALMMAAAVLVVTYISAFFTAAAVGMSAQATKTGKTRLDDLFTYGKKKAFDVFLADALIFFLSVLLGIVLALVAAAPLIIGSLNLVLAVAALDFAVLLLVFTLLSFALASVSYAIVLSDLRAVDGLRASYRFFMENKLAVAFMLFTVSGAYSAYSLLTNTLGSFFGMVPLLGGFIELGVSLLAVAFSLAVMQPITTVWWTRLYLDRAGVKKTT